MTMPLVVSSIDPPGNAPRFMTRHKGQTDKSWRPFYTIFQDSEGNRYEYHRGWTARNSDEIIREAVPGRCSWCVGEVELGHINPDGTRDILHCSSRPEFYGRGEKCESCKRRGLRDAVEHAVKQAEYYGWTVRDLIDALLERDYPLEIRL